MSLALVVYLINMVPNIKVIAFIFLLVALFMTFCVTMNGVFDGKWQAFRLMYKKLIAVISVCLICIVFVPSERTMYVMLAAYGVQQVATNEKTQRILGSGVDILNLQLEKYKDELLKEKSK